MIRTVRKRLLFRAGLYLGFFVLCFSSSNLGALEINDDGRSLILEAQQTYHGDMESRPVCTNKVITEYVTKIVKSLVPKGKLLPPGVTLSVTILESPQPELYSYVDGHIVMTTGVLNSIDNEAQLAGVLSREVATVTEGYYISIYQEIKAAERKERRKAAVGALFGAFMDVAVDYAVDIESIELEDEWWNGGAAYSVTWKKLAALRAAQSAYYSIKDVAASIPEKDDKGQWIDPRLRFEPVADAQGMEYTALAGYDCRETARGWEKLYSVKKTVLKKQEAALGPWADQMRQTQKLMQMNMNRVQQSLGASGLVQTRSDLPPTRAKFVSKMTNLKEVREAEKKVTPTKGQKHYQSFIKSSLIPQAEKEMQNENYERAYVSYRALWDKGIKTAPVAYGMAKCSLGDFAFGASESEKKEAEQLYREAARLDSSYALPYKGLGELYDDWERYGEAARAYRTYLTLNPAADDRERIERKIKTLDRKANR